MPVERGPPLYRGVRKLGSRLFGEGRRGGMGGYPPWFLGPQREGSGTRCEGKGGIKSGDASNIIA